MKPTVGRIVHYRTLIGSEMLGPPGAVIPGIITRVHAFDRVDLTLFPPGNPPVTAEDVGPADDLSSRGRWSWPERAS